MNLALPAEIDISTRFEVLDHVPVGSCIIDNQFTVLFWNRTLENWTSIDRHKLVGKPLGQSFPQLLNAKFKSMLRKTLNGGSLFLYSPKLPDQIFPATGPDGSACLLQATISNIPLDDGSYLAHIAVEDITGITNTLEDLRETRNQAQKLAQAAQSATMAKSEFLANMSHELRTPLNSINILATMLAEDTSGRLQKKDKESAQIIRRSGQILQKLINDILDLAKVEAGKRVMVNESVSLQEIAHDVWHTMSPIVANKDLKFQFEIDSTVSEYINTDAEALSQILRNLISNAAKFTHRGQVAVKIEHATSTMNPPPPDNSRWLAISTIDTGIGITPDRIDAVFTPFIQASGTTGRQYGGTGLGLSISRGMAEAMNGKLSVASQKDQGSTFTLFLPDPAIPINNSCYSNWSGLCLTNRPSKPHSSADVDFTGTINIKKKIDCSRDSKPRLNLSGSNILVINDDMRNLYQLSGMLEKCGASTLAARTEDEGIAVIGKHQDINLVLLDLSGPIEKILRVIADSRTRDKSATTKVLVLGNTQKQRSLRTLLDPELELWLDKPLRESLLIKNVGKLLSTG